MTRPATAASQPTPATTGGPRGRLQRCPPDRLVAVAVAASVVMVAVSWSDGGLPVDWRPPLIVAAQFAHYVALLCYCVVWLELGRRLYRTNTSTNTDDEVDVGVLRRLILRSATPFLLAAPFGHDLGAYAAQGHLVGRGLDPYAHGPASVPGVFTHEVSTRWLHSPAPYGPAWLRISQFGAWLSNGHPLLAQLLLRLPAYAGLLLCLWGLPRLARCLAMRTDRALWLGIASPLVPVFGVGGGHNDLIMLGLSVAGLAIAAGPSWWHLAGGAAVIGVAVMIKSPALVVLAFTVPVWLAARRMRDSAATGIGQLVRACGAAVGGAAVVIAVLQLISGLGLGWARQADADPGFNSPFSLPSAIVLLSRTIAGLGAPAVHDTALHVVRTAGVLLAAATVAVLWLRAVERARRTGSAPLGLLAAALLFLALLAPLVQPWYFGWALLFAGFVLRRPRALVLAAAAAILLTAMILPSGRSWLGNWGVLVQAPFVLALCVVVLRVNPRR